MHRTRLALALVLVAAAAAVTACGGSGLAADPAKVLADAQLPPPGPNRSALQIVLSPGAADGAATGADGLGGLLGGPIQIDATTAGDAATGVTADGSIATGPLEVPFSFRQGPDDAWVQIGGTWYALGQPLGVDFAALGSALGDVAALVRDPKATAVEDIGGIECDRITGTLAPGAAAADALDGVAGGLPLDLSALADGTAQVSVWIARGDHVVRRIQVDTAAVDSAAGGLLVDLTVLPGEPVEVQPPAGAKPLTALLTTLLGAQAGDALDGAEGLDGIAKLLESGQLDLSGLLGGAGGLGGLLGGATTGSGA